MMNNIMKIKLKLKNKKKINKINTFKIKIDKKI